MEKRTDKIKKVSYGGFYADIRNWNPKGRSTLEKTRIIHDQKNCIIHQLTRIRKLKYVIECLEKERDARVSIEKVREVRSQYRRKLENQKNKVAVRDNHLEKYEAEIKILTENLKVYAKENDKLLRTEAKNKDIISELKATKRKVVVKEIPKALTASEKRVERLAGQPLSERGVNTMEATIKMGKFSADNNISVTNLSILMQIDQFKSVKFSELILGTRVNLKFLVDNEYINHQLTKQVKNYFLTAKGDKIVKALKDYISYNKVI